MRILAILLVVLAGLGSNTYAMKITECGSSQQTHIDSGYLQAAKQNYEDIIKDLEILFSEFPDLLEAFRHGLERCKGEPPGNIVGAEVLEKLRQTINQLSKKDNE